jgi:hypothetical protein
MKGPFTRTCATPRGFTPIAGNHIVGCNDADSAMAKILKVEHTGHLDLLVLPGTVEENKQLLTDDHRQRVVKGSMREQKPGTGRCASTRTRTRSPARPATARGGFKGTKRQAQSHLAALAEVVTGTVYPRAMTVGDLLAA